MTRKLTLFLVCAFEITLILFVVAWTAWADSYPIGKKGDVIAEQWSQNRGEWDPVVLFFGHLDDWEICEEYRKMVKQKSGTKMRCVINR